jgi:septum formation protein
VLRGRVVQVVHVVLASSSPRRRELLERLGVSFEVIAPDVDEGRFAGEDPSTYVTRLALDKAGAVDVSGRDVVVLAADTIVELDGEVFGKPVDADDARRMLRRLSGRTHRVHTAVAVRRDQPDVRCDVELVTTYVTMVAIGPALLEWYLATGEPLDKAGGYALQGAGDVLVDHIRGSVSNVVGLPLVTVARLLEEVAPFAG